MSTKNPATYLLLLAYLGKRTRCSVLNSLLKISKILLREDPIVQLLVISQSSFSVIAVCSSFYGSFSHTLFSLIITKAQLNYI